MTFGLQVMTSEGLDNVLEIDTPLLFAAYSYTFNSSSPFSNGQLLTFATFPYPAGWNSPTETNGSIAERSLVLYGLSEFEIEDALRLFVFAVVYDDVNRVINFNSNYVSTSNWSAVMTAFLLSV